MAPAEFRPCHFRFCDLFLQPKLNVAKINYQHVSPKANVSHFPFIFFSLSGFNTLLVTTCLLRLFTQDFYHSTTMIDNTKTISCTVRATYYARITWISWKTTHSSIDILCGINRCVTSLPHVSNACLFFPKRTGISSFWQIINRPVASFLTSEKDLFSRTNMWTCEPKGLCWYDFWVTP